MNNNCEFGYTFKGCYFLYMDGKLYIYIYIYIDEDKLKGITTKK